MRRHENETQRPDHDLSDIRSGLVRVFPKARDAYGPIRSREDGAAIAEARATFDQFLARFHDPHPGDRTFNVKVRIEDGNGAEHFWVGDLNMASEPYSGKIGNEPGIVQCVKFGQIYQFRRADVSDWMYFADGRMQGNFTLRVELESMPPEEAAALKKKCGW